MVQNKELLKILVQKNLTLTNLSERTNIPITKIQAIVEHDFKNASIGNAIKIAQALDVELHEIIPEIKPSQTNNQLEREIRKLKKDYVVVSNQYDNLVKEVTTMLWKHL
ncbi:helix-turn-helix transcriptional regulator [Solibacillus sp. FSL H8-0523]|uniref:helix-turn-helix domain-containing protein n=1 Tax=Solibacillus sp. FSL H8-0523 TaxID=2954511 RepID=UPI00310137BC